MSDASGIVLHMFDELPLPDGDLLVVEPVGGVPEMMAVLDPGAQLGVMLEAVSDRSG